MQVVTVARDLTVAVEVGRRNVHLDAGRSYVLHDAEVHSGRAAAAFDRVAPLPARPQPWASTRAAGGAGAVGGRLILPYIGGLGDAVSLLPVLASLRRQHPALAIDVAATTGPAQVFALSPRVDHVLPYPLAHDAWIGYDHYLSLEAVAETGQQPGRPLPETFASALGIALTDRSFELSLPRAAESAAAQPAAVPLVAIAVGPSSTHRSYPAGPARELVGRLVEAGMCCVLLGHDGGALQIPVCAPIVTDMRNRTPSVLELSVWLKAVDVVVSHDSFIMHLAGALGRPAVALFSPTSRAHAAPYPSTDALASARACAPCHAVGSACPLGHDRCLAWDDAAVSPQAVADAVLKRLGERALLPSVAAHG